MSAMNDIVYQENMKTLRSLMLVKEAELSEVDSKINSLLATRRGYADNLATANSRGGALNPSGLEQVADLRARINATKSLISLTIRQFDMIKALSQLDWHIANVSHTINNPSGLASLVSYIVRNAYPEGYSAVAVSSGKKFDEFFIGEKIVEVLSAASPATVEEFNHIANNLFNKPYKSVTAIEQRGSSIVVVLPKELQGLSGFLAQVQDSVTLTTEQERNLEIAEQQIGSIYYWKDKIDQVDEELTVANREKTAKQAEVDAYEDEMRTRLGLPPKPVTPSRNGTVETKSGGEEPESQGLNITTLLIIVGITALILWRKK